MAATYRSAGQGSAARPIQRIMPTARPSAGYCDKAKRANGERSNPVDLPDGISGEFSTRSSTAPTTLASRSRNELQMGRQTSCSLDSVSPGRLRENALFDPAGLSAPTGPIDLRPIRIEGSGMNPALHERRQFHVHPARQIPGMTPIRSGPAPIRRTSSSGILWIGRIVARLSRSRLHMVHLPLFDG